MRAQAFLNLMLACTSVPGQYPSDETISETTSYFWSLFLDELNLAEDSVRGALLETSK